MSPIPNKSAVFVNLKAEQKNLSKITMSSKTTEVHHHHCRICVMGLRGVGKTSFLRSAIHQSNDPEVNSFFFLFVKND